MPDPGNLRLSRELSLELARYADTAAIAQLSREHIEHGLGWTWTAARVGAQIRDRETTVLVARDRRELAGFAIMSYGQTRAHLNLLAVHPGYRRRRVGTQLVQWLEAAARVAGIGAVHLEVRANNDTARGFYRALGYREIGWIVGYYRGVEAAVRMLHLLWKPPPGSGSSK